jgi:hypothetical protein
MRNVALDLLEVLAAVATPETSAHRVAEREGGQRAER